MTDPAGLVDRLEAGNLRLYELEDHADPDTAAAARRQYLERSTETSLDTVGDYAFDAGRAESNIENMIGTVQVPMGIAGPVPVDGEQADGQYYLPIATTEGGLVASVNRGCSTIQAAGGATARVTRAGMTRAPVFAVEDIAAAKATVEWVQDHEQQLRDAAESTTSHGELLSVDPYVVGNSVFLRFTYDTKDAMGMNMATIATDAACTVVTEHTGAELISLSGNLCADKKPAAINAVEGRGHSVTADVCIPREVVNDRLDAEPEAIQAVNTRKNLIGSAKAGSLGFNAQVANVVAGTFLALGQDEAHVVEGSNAIVTAEARPNELYASVSLASLQIGTVGGGTTLPTQAEALSVLGVDGGGEPAGSNADALAEIIATGALAGELSLLGALADDTLADAHATLGR